MPTAPPSNPSPHSNWTHSLTDFTRRYWVVLVVTSLCLGISILAYSTFIQAAHKAQINATNARALQQHNALFDTLKSYEKVLTITRGFIHASNYVDRDEWKKFVDSSELQRQFPNVQAFTYIQRVESENIQEFVNEIHAQGLSDVQITTHQGIKPQSGNQTRYIVKYSEPTHRNQGVIGLDIAANPANKDVYDRAADTGTVQISVPFQLKQQEANNDQCLGVILALPHYNKEMPIETIAQRRAAVRGWVAIVLDMEQFVSILNPDSSIQDRVILNTTDFDGKPVKLFDTYTHLNKDPPPNAQSENAIHTQSQNSFTESFGGRIFHTTIKSNNANPIDDLTYIEFNENLKKANIALFLGIKVTAFLVMLTIFIAYGRNRAIKLVNTMTLALRKSEKEQREFAYHAQQANKSKSIFLANMSHEIRTPMTAVLGYTDLLSEMIPQHNQPEEMRDAITRISNAGSHLLTVINDVLDLSKIESGKLIITPTNCQIGETLAEVLSTMKPAADQSNLALDIQFDTPIPETIITDPYRVRQILLNLVGNAIKFTDQGTVTIRVKSHNNTLTLAVHDTGIGLHQDRLENLFHPFEQDDPTQEFAKKGTGLGLSISRKLAEMMQGSLTATSILNHGSTFTCTLPILNPNQHTNTINKLPANQSTQTHQQPYKQLSGKILIAEDGPDNQRLIKHYLTKAGLKAHFVWNGQEAVDLYNKDQSFDLIILDMQMPILDGYQASTKLRESGCTLPILALTANAMSGDRQRCLASGCDEYETKPLDRARLLRTIQRLLDSQQSTDQHAA